MSLAHALLQWLIEVLCKECCARVEEGGERCNQCTNETNSYNTLDTCRQYVLNHYCKSSVGIELSSSVYAHIKARACLVLQSNGNHARDKEHEARQNLEETCGNCTAACTCNNLCIVLARLLAKHTLYNVLVGTPIPETDD